MSVVPHAGIEPSHSIEELTKSRIRETKKGRLTLRVVCLRRLITLNSLQKDLNINSGMPERID
jgi:hypothetical protein